MNYDSTPHNSSLYDMDHDVGENFLKNWLEERYDTHVVQDILTDVKDMRNRDDVLGLLKKMENIVAVNDN